MSAWYREINVEQEPFDMGLDSTGRIKWGFNITAEKASSDNFKEEIIGLLVAAAVGTFGIDIFSSSKVKVPDGAGPFLHFTETGGATPERTHNEIGPPAYQRPSAKLVARAETRSAAIGMARSAYDALVGIRNRVVAG